MTEFQGWLLLAMLAWIIAAIAQQSKRSDSVVSDIPETFALMGIVLAATGVVTILIKFLSLG